MPTIKKQNSSHYKPKKNGSEHNKKTQSIGDNATTRKKPVTRKKSSNVSNHTNANKSGHDSGHTSGCDSGNTIKHKPIQTNKNNVHTRKRTDTRVHKNKDVHKSSGGVNHSGKNEKEERTNKEISKISKVVRKFKPADKLPKKIFDIDDSADNTKEVTFDGKTLRLKKFHPEMLMRVAKNPTVAMIAKRGSGKSTAIRAIMDYYKDIPGGNIISKTEKMSPFFSKFFPDLFIFYDYVTEIVQNLLDRQEDIKDKRFKKEKRIKNPSTVDTRAWLIMDDCLAQKGKWAKDGPILEVFLNGRHYDLFFILTMQYPLGIGPDLRSNFDFIFIFFSNYINIQRKIWEQYAGMFDTFDAFKYVFNKCTTNFGCMVINNRINSENIDDIVYWWRAEDKELNDFIGHKSFVAYYNKYYDRHYLRKLRLEKKKKKFNVGDMCRKKRNSCDFKVSLLNN